MDRYTIRPTCSLASLNRISPSFSCKRDHNGEFDCFWFEGKQWRQTLLTCAVISPALPANIRRWLHTLARTRMELAALLSPARSAGMEVRTFWLTDMGFICSSEVNSLLISRPIVCARIQRYHDQIEETSIRTIFRKFRLLSWNFA